MMTLKREEGKRINNNLVIALGYLWLNGVRKTLWLRNGISFQNNFYTKSTYNNVIAVYIHKYSDKISLSLIYYCAMITIIQGVAPFSDLF